MMHAVALWLLQAVAVGRGADQPSAIFSVAPLKVELDDAGIIGRRRAGLICAPAGAIRWRDVGLNGAEGAAAIAAGLHDAGVPVQDPETDTDLPAPRAGGYRLVARLTEVRLQVCSPQWGAMRLIERKHTLKGEGFLKVDWRIYDVAARKLLKETSVETTMALSGSTSTLAGAVRVGLAENAGRLAPALHEIDR